jgi:hypothetical protein
MNVKTKFRNLPIGDFYVVEGTKCFPYTERALLIYQKQSNTRAVCVKQLGYPNTNTVGAISVLPKNYPVLHCDADGNAI